MSLVRFRTNPIERSFDQMFKNVFNDDFDGFFVKPFASQTFPAVNVVEGKENFRIDFSVPGFSKGDFNIKLDGNILTVSGEKKAEVKKEEENYTMREFTHNSFSRSFTLPETVNPEQIGAEYTDGILKLTLPKREEVKQKAIEIKVS
ncbi:MAG: Hsp20/alpha crystallin family protein [Chitinophagales bacterium]|nr:Hsp20/alpha crystallin family protein [Chitinophagales bacterium]